MSGAAVTAFAELVRNLRDDTQQWRQQANCRGTNPDLFYPDKGEPRHLINAMCTTCPVQAECLNAGLGERLGWWGGISPRDRERIRAARRRQRRDVSRTTLTKEQVRAGAARETLPASSVTVSHDEPVRQWDTG